MGSVISIGWLAVELTPSASWITRDTVCWPGGKRTLVWSPIAVYAPSSIHQAKSVILLSGSEELEASRSISICLGVFGSSTQSV